MDATFAKFDHLAQTEAKTDRLMAVLMPSSIQSTESIARPKTIVESQGNLADLPLDQMNTHSSFGSSID